MAVTQEHFLVPSVFGGNAYRAVTLGRYVFPRRSMGTRWAGFLLASALLIAMLKNDGLGYRDCESIPFFSKEGS